MKLVFVLLVFITVALLQSTTALALICPTDYTPVCAQPPMPECPINSYCRMPEKQTYSNLCVAKIEKAKVLHDGKCPSLGGEENPLQICTEQYAPVCGQPPMQKCPPGVKCELMISKPQTYSNSCNARVAKAQVLYRGECGKVDSSTIGGGVALLSALPIKVGEMKTCLAKTAKCSPKKYFRNSEMIAELATSLEGETEQVKRRDAILGGVKKILKQNYKDYQAYRRCQADGNEKCNYKSGYHNFDKVNHYNISWNSLVDNFDLLSLPFVASRLDRLTNSKCSNLTDAILKILVDANSRLLGVELQREVEKEIFAEDISKLPEISLLEFQKLSTIPLEYDRTMPLTEGKNQKTFRVKTPIGNFKVEVSGVLTQKDSGQAEQMQITMYNMDKKYHTSFSVARGQPISKWSYYRGQYNYRGLRGLIGKPNNADEVKFKNYFGFGWNSDI
ncbi:MAG: hypothetical protein HN353_12380 [Bdellovibrionales bacterium]|jgi:hypothetical protein|nr:hypothetical protein [Bdellovibrionales bacterium]MBT3526312.1 hypothetical protein [Bdellovibrionales bacterium]MBT7669191.1 hypothetical protein [Bdellovibrionales bacterium]MBT7768333.1 hypothetical protein [Bdellovibrionales bacterium]